MEKTLKKILNIQNYLYRIRLTFFYLIRSILAKWKIIVIREIAQLEHKRIIDPYQLPYPDMDFIRISSLELIMHEIAEKNVPGAVAELGVYYGGFAKFISLCFPDRKLYLFDTFEGFAESDLKAEQQKGFSSVFQDFKVEDLEVTLKKITNRDNCIIKKGLFPHTAMGLEETFCFVSIDTDLYQPIYEGLKYFYPRLQKGGYIFVHDYNHSWYKGAKQAVRDFCSENNCSYFPLSDYGGSAIINK